MYKLEYATIYTQFYILLLSLNIYNIIIDFSPDHFFQKYNFNSWIIKYAFLMDWSLSGFLFTSRSWEYDVIKSFSLYDDNDAKYNL